MKDEIYSPDGVAKLRVGLVAGEASRVPIPPLTASALQDTIARFEAELRNPPSYALSRSTFRSLLGNIDAPAGPKGPSEASTAVIHGIRIVEMPGQKRACWVFNDAGTARAYERGLISEDGLEKMLAKTVDTIVKPE